MKADHDGGKRIPIYAYILPVILLGVAMLAALVVSARDGRSMMEQYVPLQDAIMLAKNDITQFRLSIEHHYFNNNEPKGVDWKRLDHAEFVADAMVKGGRDDENIYIPMKDPEFAREATLLDSKIDKVREYANVMSGHEGDRAFLAVQDEVLDAALDASEDQASRVEVVLHELVSRRLDEFNLLIQGLMAICILFTIGAVAAIAIYGRKQSRYIAALTAAGEQLKENEQELSAALGRIMLLSSAVEASPDVFQITDMAGYVMYSNKALVDVYGYTPEEFIGRHVGELNVDPEFSGTAILPAVSESGAWSGELTVKHQDGHTFPVWLTASLIRDESGGPVAMVGVVRDITERKRAENELKKFKFILDNAGEEVYLIEPSGRYAYMNITAMKSLGYPPSELSGLKIGDVNKSMDERTWHEHFNMHKAGDVPPFEINHVNKDGKHTPKEVKAVYMEVGGREYICSFARDITDRKNMEQYRSDFYAMVTHDLKSPLTSILTCAYLLLERVKLTDDDDAALLNAIKNGGERMVALVEDFLTFEKAESGKLILNLIRSDVSEILADIGNDMRALADKRGLVLTMAPKVDVPGVMLDRKQVERAVRNLIVNALTYTPRGGLVTVSTEKAERNGGLFIAFSVSDTGPGIQQEEISKVFNKYYRSPKTAGTKGTGLGLAIVEAVAKAHGGIVEVDSEPGKGSTFRLLLPVQP